MNEVELKVSSGDLIQLFNGLLSSPKSVFKKKMVEREKLLKYIWSHVDDRTKEESLWNKNFRKNVLDIWNIPYEEDLIRLKVPKILEGD